MSWTDDEVLVVEDDRDILMLLLKALRGIGCVPNGRSNGTLARTHIEKLIDERRPPSLIISDIGLNGQDGIEFMKWCATQPALARTVRVLLTAQPARAAELAEGTVHAVYTKPVSSREFITEIQQMMEARDAQ